MKDELDIAARNHPAEAGKRTAGRSIDFAWCTTSEAAEMAGITKREFIESVGRYGVSIFQYSPEELERDLARL